MLLWDNFLEMELIKGIFTEKIEISLKKKKKYRGSSSAHQTSHCDVEVSLNVNKTDLLQILIYGNQECRKLKRVPNRRRKQDYHYVGA